MRISSPLVTLRVRRCFRASVREEQPIGDVIAPGDGQILLTKRLRPAERGKDRPDEIVLGLAFIRALVLRKGGGDVVKPSAQCRHIDGAIRSSGLDRFNDIISGEQRTGNEQPRISQMRPLFLSISSETRPSWQSQVSQKPSNAMSVPEGLIPR